MIYSEKGSGLATSPSACGHNEDMVSKEAGLYGSLSWAGSMRAGILVGSDSCRSCTSKEYVFRRIFPPKKAVSGAVLAAVGNTFRCVWLASKTRTLKGPCNGKVKSSSTTESARWGTEFQHGSEFVRHVP